MKIRYNCKVTVLMAVLLLAVPSCSDPWEGHTEPQGPYISGTVFDALGEMPSVSVFYRWVKETGYETVLKNESDLTVLAPGNEALLDLGEVELETKRSIVANSISYGSYNTGELAVMPRLKMVNGKNLDLKEDLTLVESSSDNLCSNGFVHIVAEAAPPRLSVEEYLSGLDRSRYMQLERLYARSVEVVDEEKSVQTGVDDNGDPIYEYVYKTSNWFLDTVPIDNEDSTYVFILLENADFQRIAAKYAKYMQMPTAELTGAFALDELIVDLITDVKTGRSVNGVAPDLSSAIAELSYKASNGRVLVMSGVDIKMADKVQEVMIEAEDFVDAYDPSYIFTRRRSWASGQKDIVLSSRTYQNGGSFTISSSSMNTNTNFYITYKARLYSTTYDIYSLSYCDIEDLIVPGEPDSPSTLTVCHKMFVSLPGEPELYRDSGTAAIENDHRAKQYAFVSSSIAGIMEENRFQLYNLTANTGTTQRMYPTTIADLEDTYGLAIPTMGEATLMVCNTAGHGDKYSSVTAANLSGGLMFLDYIRLVPRIEDGD